MTHQPDISCVGVGSPLSSRFESQGRRQRALNSRALAKMKDSLYHSMDAPVAPIENKIEALRPAEKACFVLDLCASRPALLVPSTYCASRSI